MFAHVPLRLQYSSGIQPSQWQPDHPKMPEVTSSSFDPANTDVHSFHPALDAHLAFEEQGFKKVRKIADAIHGQVYLYVMRRDGRAEEVVVKSMENGKVEQTRIFEANDRMAFYAGSIACEDALNEIGVLLYINRQPDMCRYLLRSIGVFRGATHTMVVTEHCGAGELFGQLAERKFSESEVKRFMLQLFQAVAYLHGHNIGHRDISLENLLVKHGELRLMDFGQAVQIHHPEARERRFRYFRLCGKQYYRAPECYLPRSKSWQAPCPPDYTFGTVVMVQHEGFFTEVVFQPGFVVGQVCLCDPCGFEVPPLDLFACGVVLFILHTRQPPWRMALLSDQLFRFIFEHGIAPLWRGWNQATLSVHGMNLLSCLTSSFPTARPSIQQCLDHPWFADQIVSM